MPHNIEGCKGRNVVEQGLNKDKQARGVASRYDKRADLIRWSSSERYHPLDQTVRRCTLGTSVFRP